MKKTIGIIGGMGPAATVDLMDKIVKLTKADCDQDHIRMIVDSNTNITDRTAAILHGGTSPVSEMVKSARILEGAGADFLIMPCNTAHYFAPDIESAVSIPLLSITECTAKKLEESGARKAAVLATDGTVQSGVYGKRLEEHGIEPLYPDAEGQKVVMSLIYDYVKKNIFDAQRLPAKQVHAIVNQMRDAGADGIILGCTELPMAFQSLGLYDGCVDATLELARAAVLMAGAELA